MFELYIKYALVVNNFNYVIKCGAMPAALINSSEAAHATILQRECFARQGYITPLAGVIWGVHASPPPWVVEALHSYYPPVTSTALAICPALPLVLTYLLCWHG